MEKLYLYGIIKGNVKKSFGVLDMKAEIPIQIESKTFKGLSIICSKIEIEDDEEIMATRKNLVNHQKTIERVMEEYTILPFRFGMVVDDIAALQQVITDRKDYFFEKLESIEGKIELSLKGMWNNMEPVYKHITETQEDISALKSRLQQTTSPSQNDKIELGKMVEFALTLEKERLSDKIITKLSNQYEDYRLNKNITENMFCNLAFLVNKSDEPAFDSMINALGEELNDNISFKYVGPLPPYNFLD